MHTAGRQPAPHRPSPILYRFLYTEYTHLQPAASPHFTDLHRSFTDSSTQNTHIYCLLTSWILLRSSGRPSRNLPCVVPHIDNNSSPVLFTIVVIGSRRLTRRTTYSYQVQCSPGTWLDQACTVDRVFSPPGPGCHSHGTIMYTSYSTLRLDSIDDKWQKGRN